MHIVIAHFGTHYVNNPGGVEKVICQLSGEMIRRGHAVTILYRDRCEGDPYFPLDSRVVQHNILFQDGKKIISDKLPVRLRALREIVRVFSKSGGQEMNARFKGRQYGMQIQKYLQKHPADVVLSCSVPSTKYVIDDAHCTAPVIQMMHSHPCYLFPNMSKAEIAAVRKCRALQILLPSGLKTAREFFPDLPVKVIGNPVYPPVKKAHPGDAKEKHLISCVGSLTKNKQQHLLAEAFGLLAADHPDWNVEFWGYSGHYGSRIQSWADKHSLSGRILIKGQTTHVEDVYARSDIFCLPSRAEGWGLGLTEAMAAGVPAVGFKGCTGVEDLIQDGVTGFLADKGSVESLAEALKALMDDAEKRTIMGRQAAESMKQYAPEKIWDEWEALLQDVSTGKE
ncbi:Glycosyltransferase involved in cell wall bisynthesis [Dialister histaminiformans]|uniref:Glycosyltransferase involved in cell wall bisynthesis n=1 Tax=Allisonella histaminiformans TaxID=209880 RepID=A0A1G5WAA3_9FIRM|nr:glycosyltransferase [Allisonella histaminiformans]PWL46373.1 MAG: glycosyltransferase family 4 protein [Veillonellaceae bacterium]SDA55038.1 Glycosyltransferase involved in cell wall bisynthesis [Allisonella histaminiformans]